MPGSLSIPNVFATQAGNVPVSELDTDLSGIATYVNAREITLGTIGARPAAGVSGRLYVATDVGGGTLYEDNGSTWTQIAAPVVVTVSSGGTGVVSLTAHAVLIGEGTSPIASVALTKGQLLVGQSAADPVALSIGTDGQVLTLDSTTGAGVKWATAGGGGGGSAGMGVLMALKTNLTPLPTM